MLFAILQENKDLADVVKTKQNKKTLVKKEFQPHVVPYHIGLHACGNLQRKSGEMQTYSIIGRVFHLVKR